MRLHESVQGGYCIEAAARGLVPAKTVLYVAVPSRMYQCGGGIIEAMPGP